MSLSLPAARLPHPYRPEVEALADAMALLHGRLDWPAVQDAARPWVAAVRAKPAPFWALESLLREYPITSSEGLALMRLAEALLRVPDVETAVALTADQLGRADFGAAEGDGPHRWVAGLSSQAIALSKWLLPAEGEAAGSPSLWQRLGARTVVAATVRAIQLLGRQFVLGRHIDEAMSEGADQRADYESLRFSYDMLGEGARTDADAQRYLAAYAQAIDAIAARADQADWGATPQQRDGISIKLSALHPRYEEAQHARVMAELVPRAWPLIERAAPAHLNLTIDAEESDRLELSLDVLDALCARVAQQYPDWRGLGLAVQAYQTRALHTIAEAVRIARKHGLQLMVRLVKGAYWDGEIKRAQEMGLAGYPVYTQKAHTDVSYLACAAALLAEPDAVYPQFATHNAGTIAAILQLAQRPDGQPAPFEMQRLHGMGIGVYREVLASNPELALRIYAPVGEHRDLLAYLVRRLLENGANSSFVHQLADESVALDTLLASPMAIAQQGPIEGDAAAGLNAPHLSIPLPLDLYGVSRRNSAGADLACRDVLARMSSAVAVAQVAEVPIASAAQIDAAMQRLHAGFANWNARGVVDRAAVLQRAARLLEQRTDAYCALLVREGRKTLPDCVAEVREAVDFCRYYAQQAEEKLQPQALPGPTGESNELRLHGRGVFVCISPWNFPLAIFAGQVVAALVAGNTVAAKPAEQTPAVAAAFVNLLHEAGVPDDALALLHGPGETVGAALVADARTAGVCFTGSTAVARAINRSLAAKDGPIVPLIAETGGLNAMVVDSTALPEQVIDAVVQSAFRSAGQRCSALRLLCVHESIADGVIEMLHGAMAELQLGDPALLATDVGPVIDAEAHANLTRHRQRLDNQARLLAATKVPPRTHDDNVAATADLFAPAAYEIARIADLTEEIFGPVLHVVRWSGDVDEVVAEVNALGYGLTFGIQTRIDSRAQRLAGLARIGNVYVNRNTIGAVVGVQPFGGEGLSGTGPKAGGPHYLYRFCAEQTLTINTTAAGGNAALLAGIPAGGI